MIIIQLAGGLGNQLQQYALYQKFKSLGAEAKLDLSWFEQFEDTGRELKNKEQNQEQNKDDHGTNKTKPAIKQNIVVTNRQCELDFFDHLPYESCTEEERTALTGSQGLAGKLRRKLLPQTVHWYKEKQMYVSERSGCLNYAPTFFGTSLPEVTGSRENADGTVTLTVAAVCDMILCVNAVITHELTVKFADDGSFQYLGNKILNDGSKEIPEYQYRILKE